MDILTCLSLSLSGGFIGFAAGWSKGKRSIRIGIAGVALVTLVGSMYAALVL
jgi:hypothetical protein